MNGGRDLAQARRLERGAAGLRWIVVAFGVAQTAFALRDQGIDPDNVLPLEFVLVAAFAIGNVLLSTAVERASRPEQLRSVGVCAQTDSAATRRSEGAGLGLYITNSSWRRWVDGSRCGPSWAPAPRSAS